MMKRIFVGFTVLVVVALSSCTRDYYCKCTYKYSGAGHPPDQEETITIKDTKKNAIQNCEERNTVLTNAAGDSTVVVCDLF